MRNWILPGCVLGVAMILAAAPHALAGASDPAPAAAPKAVEPAVVSPGVTSPLASEVPAPQAGQGEVDRATRVGLSSWSREIQKLAQAGVDERVILLYITNAPGIFNLAPDHIILLKKQGLSPRVLNAMLGHDAGKIAGMAPGRAVAESPVPVIAAADSEPPSILAAPSPPPGLPSIIANDFTWTEEPLPEDDYFAPEQPNSAGPVRAPYAVKLNDPIIVLRLPTFSVPYW